MDNIDKNIERARIGKKHEEAFEIINKQTVKSTTNLPPFKAINKTIPHVCSTCFFNDGNIIERDVSKVRCMRVKYLIKRSKDEYCSFWKKK